MTDKSADLPESSPLAKLLAIGAKATTISTVLARGDATHTSIQGALLAISGILIDLTAVVLTVYGDQQIALRKSWEATNK